MGTIAILSDIHANVVALDAVLAELDRVQPDQVVYLGDAAATGPQPGAVIARLRAQSGWRFVRGNCDDAMLRTAAGAGKQAVDEHDEIDDWCTAQLSPEDLAFLSAFEPVVNLESDGCRICCYHGSPRSNLDEMLPSTADDQVAHWLRGHRATVFAGGHTHVQMVRRLQESYLINPGSIGLPFTYLEDGRVVNPLWAEYALVRVEGARIGIELRRTPVQREALLASADSTTMPHKPWWSSDWTDVSSR